MATIKEIKIPDIGDFNDVPVIEVLIKAGDTIKVEDPLITIESDKATMEVPSSEAGIVKEVKIKVGDKVSQGALIMLLESLGAAGDPVAASVPTVSPPPAAVSAPAGVAEVRVPDIGDFTDVPVIEVLVKVGDTVKAEDPLITLESDKATMEVPAPLGGVVQDIKVKVGDNLSQGAVILTLVTGAAPAAASSAPGAAPAPAPAAASVAAAAPAASTATAAAPATGAIDEAAFRLAYAGPAVRKLARELGVDLGKVSGIGEPERGFVDCGGGGRGGCCC
jgi:pyruvate dehydrogenase E2 component (dihydrolipoamide acetyltransferase)